TPDSNTTKASFGAEGGLLASTGWDEKLKLWDPAAGRELLDLHGSLTPQFSRNGVGLAATREGTTLRLWEVTTSGQYRGLRSPLGPGYRTWGATCSPDGTSLAQFDDSCTSLWQVTTGRSFATLSTDMCACAVFAPDGSALFARCAVGLERWPIARDAASLRIGPPQLVTSLPWDIQFGTLASSPGGKLAANLREKGAVVVFDPRDPAGVIELPGHTGWGP